MTDETMDVGYVHVGKNVMPSGEWECADDCPHPAHDEPDEASRRAVGTQPEAKTAVGPLERDATSGTFSCTVVRATMPARPEFAWRVRCPRCGWIDHFDSERVAGLWAWRHDYTHESGIPMGDRAGCAVSEVGTNDVAEAQGAWNMGHFELVGYWCSLSRRMFQFPTSRWGGEIRCCAPVYPDHRPTAVYKVRTP